MIPEYAELHCLSNFTFLRGASHPAELVTRAAELKYRAITITDECSMSGVVRAHLAAKDLDIKLIIGSEFTLVEGTKLVALATDVEGYGNLCELITRGRRRAEKGSYELTRHDFAEGLPHCLVLWVPGKTPSKETAAWVREIFPTRAWCAVEFHLAGDDRRRLARLRTMGLPLVAAGDVHMHDRSRRKLQDTVTAIRLRKSVLEARGQLYPNAERHLRGRRRLANIYPPELMAETLRIAELCNFSLDEIHYQYPKELVPEGHTPATWLRVLTEQGAKFRWPTGVPEKGRKQIEHELALITELSYEPYFLTVHDVVRFAREKGILCQGRGSAANSAVCFCLGITELDPARMNLLFERFVSKERHEPPDIDVDFEHQRREEVIQYIYGKYGRDRAAVAATLITYQPRSAVRDVAKALGLSLADADLLSEVYQWWDSHEVNAQRVKEAGLNPSSHVMQLLAELVATLLQFPRHLSQHVGGFVISHTPLCRLVPIENAAMEDRTVIQWDKDDLDALGLLKVDVLALGMLSALKRMLVSVNEIRGSDLTLATIPAEDPAVYAMIQKADTIGTFQIESRAQMAMLPILKPKLWYDLVVVIALIRPGPIQGDMVHPYLARRRGLEPVVYPSEAVRHVLERTLGVPIFQEQVMQLAVVAAGFTAGEADQLRRAMAAWRRTGSIGPFESKLINGMRERGYPDSFGQQIYKQIQGFAEYGFPESHSASFALLAYASAWLKRHEPAAFLCGLLNSQPMGFYAVAQLVQDARRHDVEIRPVDVNKSAWECTLEPAGAQPAVRLGLRMVSGLNEVVGTAIAAARPFRDTSDLARRAPIDRYAFKCLASAGALAAIAGNRHQSYWSALGVEEPWTLGEASLMEAQPLLSKPTEGQDIAADYASLRLTLGRHPLALLREQLKKRRVITAEQLWTVPDDSRVTVAGLVTHRQRPGSANGVVFATLEDETGHINIVVWADLADRQRRPLLRSHLMAVTGKAQRKGDVMHVIASKVEDYTPLLGRLQAESRDFR
ncbi:MAG TPA: error-prone DNA polymerase [Gammaproteobacteria bacterium]|jgi:error-prone DNA polymerase|nr:error-prone DNA polymerase [Gammaproteobacteria bacterium]